MATLATYFFLSTCGQLLLPIPATDKPMANEDIGPVLKMFSGKTEQGVRKHFQKISDQKEFDQNDVRAAREAIGHFPEAAAAPANAHAEKE